MTGHHKASTLKKQRRRRNCSEASFTLNSNFKYGMLSACYGGRPHAPAIYGDTLGRKYSTPNSYC